MKNWPKEDRYSWEKSEVMKEFEAQILSNYSKVEKIAQQKSLIPPETKTELNNVLNTVKEIKQTLSGAADDGQDNSGKHQCDEAEDCAVCSGSSQESSEEYSDDEVKLAKAEILQELQKMANDAIRNRDIKLAYRIERTIAEIEDDRND